MDVQSLSIWWSLLTSTESSAAANRSSTGVTSSICRAISVPCSESSDSSLSSDSRSS
ncbi:hypothetical protein PF011_g18529 [Phytophthora fragariae]|uniref:Uncharacterized protein n=1 Tax=Phytophthora fragariae TaxID=53985 RepID=A0A6A3J3Z9_9STRA|nr:hypothetical protein PF011_g18529 [Phytophthora fragariae]